MTVNTPDMSGKTGSNGLCSTHMHILIALALFLVFVTLVVGVIVIGIVIVVRYLQGPRASSQPMRTSPHVPPAAVEPAPLPPYTARGPILTPAEQRFLPALEAAVAQISGGQGRVYVQLPYSLILKVRPGLDNSQRQTYHNKIDRKTADFVIVGPGFVPRIVIELDDRTHERADRRERDEFVERALADAGVRLVRVKVRGGYDVGELVGLLAEGEGPYPISP